MIPCPPASARVSLVVSFRGRQGKEPRDPLPKHLQLEDRPSTVTRPLVPLNPQHEGLRGGLWSAGHCLSRACLPTPHVCYPFTSQTLRVEAVLNAEDSEKLGF